MKILIIGAGPFLGKSIAAKLMQLAAKEHALEIVRLERGEAERTPLYEILAFDEVSHITPKAIKALDFKRQLKKEMQAEARTHWKANRDRHSFRGRNR